MKFIYLLLFSIIFSYANNLNPHKLSKDEITYLQYSPLNIYSQLSHIKPNCFWV
jgi:hypothetical protein